MKKQTKSHFLHLIMSFAAKVEAGNCLALGLAGECSRGQVVAQFVEKRSIERCHSYNKKAIAILYSM